MSKYLLILTFLFASFTSFAGGVQANYYYSLFNTAEGNPYIETYIVFFGTTLKPVSQSNNQMAEAEVSMVFTQEGNVKQFNKYSIKSPLVPSGTAIPNFIDQQRISIAPGMYNLEIRIKDLHDSTSKELVFLDVINVEFRKDFIEFSGIQYLENYYPTTNQNILSKSGYDLVPYVHDFFPRTMKKLIIYLEIYHTDLILGNDSSFLLKYGIEKVSDQKFIESFSKTKKYKVQPLIAVIGDFNIDGLPSGNYNFRMDVIDKNNKVLASKRSYFQRSNPQTGISLEEPETIDKLIIENTFIEKVSSPDTLNDYLKSMMPIASDKEKGVILDVVKSTDTTMKRVIFFTFWKSRNHLEPENEWLAYKAKVQYVNKSFGTSIKKGYESDRGRVFLQYGEPNDFQKSDHEPSAYPYEIWHYYTIGNQRNKRFVFYNYMITGNDFVLLHSDVQGEIYDKNWERRLHERNNTMYNHDATNSDGHWGSKAKENFNK